MTPQEVYEVNLAWNDLVIAGRSAQVEQLLAEIDRILPVGWQRDSSAEQRAARNGASLPRSRCYVRKLANREVWLWLLRVSDRRVQGGLVEPSETVRYLEDNAEAICDFRTRVLEPAAKTCGLTISRDHFGPLGIVPGDVRASLWAFYESSNFTWPPAGEAVRRWHEFVVSAHQNHAAFDDGELKAWLVEKGWAEADADALFDQLLADAALLSEYDELRQPV